MQISKRCSVAVHCLICIHEFGGSEKVTSEKLAFSTGCNPVIIRGIMSALKKAGIIDIKPGTGGTSLCREPAEIDLFQICSCVEPDFLEKLVGEHTSPSEFCPVGRNIHTVLEKTYQILRGDIVKSMSGITFDDILKEYNVANQASAPSI